MKKVFIVGIITIILTAFLGMVSYAAKTVEILDGQVSITDSTGNGSGTAESYTASAKGSLISKKTNTITITNETEAESIIKFNYSVSAASSFTIDGASASETGVCTKTVAAGGSIKIVITSNSGFSNLTVKLTLTNISIEALAESADILFEFNSELGNVTVGGTAVNSGDVVTIDDENGVEVVAAPAQGAVFVGWVDENDVIVTRDLQYTQKTNGNTRKALFSKDTNGTPYFMVDDKYILSDLNEAANAGTTVVLLCNGVLEAGNYEIPAGVTLLIPFDAAHTLYTTAPDKEDVAASSKIIAYRTLTLANGANITVNGAISISAKHSYKQGSNGSPTTAYGHVAMAEGSTITVNSGAKLYAWGYITGAGTVTAKSNATVHEYFQVRDYRGGDATSGMKDNDKKVFPMSQYYVQNIEVPLTLEAGAVESGYMSVHAPLIGPQSSAVPFIGSSGMFNIASGSITKDYDEKIDRLIIDVNGTLEMQSLAISMTVSGLTPTKIDSKNYTLPVNGNITLNVNSGSVNISQNMALLPGGEINVGAGAECTLASGVSVFVYDSDEWGDYCSHQNKNILAVNYSPTRQYTRTAADLIDAKVCIEGKVNAENGFVYTTASGANVEGIEGGIVKLSAIPDTDVTYQATQSTQNGGQVLTYTPIDVTIAKLKNADETYTDPQVLGECCSTYLYTNEKWIPQDVNHLSVVEEAGVEPTCTDAGVTAKSYCSSCNTIIEEAIEIPALGHDTVNHPAQPATCDGIGWDEYVTCTRCDYSTYVEIPALGHDTVNHPAQPATCEGIGWDAYETCTRCDYTTYVEKSALGHNYGECEKEDAVNHKKVCANDANHIIIEAHTFDGFICSGCGCDKIVTSTEYTVSDGNIIIDSVLNFEIPDNAQIIIATYDANGNLIDVSLKTVATLEEITFSADGVALIKVCVWDNLDNITPISVPEEIRVAG